MKIKLTENFIEKLLRQLPATLGVAVLRQDFNSSVMERIRLDSSLALNARLSETNDQIFLRFMFASSFVAACAILLAIGITVTAPVTFEEYMVADYVVNVL